MWPGKLLDYVKVASTELVQLVSTLLLGLVFGSTICTPGWLITYIVLYELVIFYLNRGSSSYNLFFRLVLNCVFFMAMIYGNWVLRGECSVDALVYGKDLVDETLLSWFVDSVFNQIWPPSSPVAASRAERVAHQRMTMRR